MPKIDEKILRLDNQLCFALYVSARAMMRVYRPLLRSMGLTYPQYLVLLVLWESDHVSVSWLGDRLFLDSGTLTPLLKRMEKHGLVQRIRNTADEREVIVKLTAEGRRLKSRALVMPEQMSCKMGFSPERANRLRKEVRALSADLNRIIAAEEDTSSVAAPGHRARRCA